LQSRYFWVGWAGEGGVMAGGIEGRFAAGIVTAIAG